MHPDDLRWPALFHDDKAYFLERSEQHTGSYFGGPFEGEIRGVNPPPWLHHIAMIGPRAFPPLNHLIGGGKIRLLYGMTYEGCELRYRNLTNHVELISLSPTEPSADWPYVGYPPHLPYIPLRLGESFDCSIDQFNELSTQPSLEVTKRSEALIIIPACPSLGMSLWGPSGDLNCVQLVCRYDLDTHTASIGNQCG